MNYSELQQINIWDYQTLSQSTANENVIFSSQWEE